MFEQLRGLEYLLLKNLIIATSQVIYSLLSIKQTILTNFNYRKRFIHYEDSNKRLSK